MDVDEPDEGGTSTWVVAAIASVVVGVLVVGLMAAGAVFVAVLGGAVASNTAAQAAAGSCLGAGTSGGVLVSGPGAGGGGLARSDLSPEQVERAREIVAVGEQRGLPQRAVVIALATAAQESGYRNYANDGTGQLRADQRDVALSLDFPHDAVGRDHGSVNAFQQQYPIWGPLEVLMEPLSAAGLFYDALLEVDGWDQLPVTVAAQRVQRSAFPDAYADDEALAVQLATELAGAGAGALSGGTGDVVPAAASGPVLCGGGPALTCAPTGLAGEEGLTPDALRVLRCVQQTFGDHTYGGVGKRAANPGSDHPSGRAVDVMVDAWDTSAGRAHGDDVAAYLQTNAAGLGVKYLIWGAQIWHAERPDEGWRPYTHPSGGGGPTLAHLDHVHVSVYGDAATAPAGTGGPWVLPTSGPVTSPFGMRMHPIRGVMRMHNGQDLAPPAGTPVVAAAAGTVTHSGPMGTYGNLVIIDHDGGVQTYYAHLQNGLLPLVGTPVQAGQLIARVGSTGGSTGPHLHFEVRVAGEPVDPVAYLAQRGVIVLSRA
ncbi:M23 family metallopeptidase [uncultured Pseudokineococcus sp.]|uniref:M23 family metallopeptidase n=1 Tax=uncultured Pseudokineococcus sp. TaxID=1642928 RepID=UPI00262F0F80|nr:M23 family metallopeptidase [uncultured Pseudokineococcus sp.]